MKTEKRTLRSDKKPLLSIKNKLLQRSYQHISNISHIPSDSPYNITVSHESKFIWFRVAKVGTQTIFHHLEENDVSLDVGKSSYLHYPMNQYEDYFKFAFVRNPWDRLVSCWHNKVVEANYFRFSEPEHEKMKDFENFVIHVSELDVEVSDRHVQLQSALIDLNQVNYIGRMESFNDDLTNVFQKIGLNKKKRKPRNVSPSRKPYQEYYSEELAETVYRTYKKDIQIFGYEF